MQQLLQRFPQRFSQPRQVTDRKPAKGEKEVTGDVDFVKPEALTKLVTQGQAVLSWPDAPTGGASTTAVTAEAVNSILAAGSSARRAQSFRCLFSVHDTLRGFSA